MNFRFALYAGMRHLFAYRRKGGSLWRMSSAVLGIALSLVPLNLVLVVTNGMIEGITERFIEIGTGHIQVRTFQTPESEQLDRVEKLIAESPGVTLSRLTIEGKGLIYAHGRRSGILVKAFPEDIFSRDEGLRTYLEIQQGAFDLSKDEAIILSSEVAKTLQVELGDEVTLLVSANPGGRGVVIRPNTFIVEGIFSTGYYELDSLTAYIGFQRGRRIFRNSGSLYFGMKVEDPFNDIESVAEGIKKKLPKDWYTYTWYELEKPMYETFRTTKSILLCIMLLILLVASVNISSSLVMLVLEKEQDIAILKSAGTSPATIAASFITTGFFLGLVGTIIGMAVGLVLAININGIIVAIESSVRQVGLFFSSINGGKGSASATSMKILDPAFYLEEIPIRVHWLELWGISVFSILCATLAAYIPSRRAGRVRPLEIIQKH